VGQRRVVMSWTAMAYFLAAGKFEAAGSRSTFGEAAAKTRQRPHRQPPGLFSATERCTADPWRP